MAGDNFSEARERQTGEEFSRGSGHKRSAADDFGNGFSNFFPLFLREHSSTGGVLRPNLSQSIESFLKKRQLGSETIFRHVAAILHAPSYRKENAAALRMDWPRVPVPGETKVLRASADLGATLMNLLDAEIPVAGVSKGKLRAGLRVLGLPHKKNGKALSDDDLTIRAGWGHVQTSRTGSTLVMPGLGLVNERDYTPGERGGLEQEAKALGMSSDAVIALLGNRTFDVHMNADAMWTNVPANVWAYTLGGYQVIKKWLSYREKVRLGSRAQARRGRICFGNDPTYCRDLASSAPRLMQTMRRQRRVPWNGKRVKPAPH